MADAVKAEACWICGKDLRRFGVERQLACPIHGSRGANAAAAPTQDVTEPERLTHPDYDFADPE